MNRLILLPLLLAAVSCSTKSGPKAASPASPAAFFTAQKAWCTVENGGKARDNSVDRYEEVFVFKTDGSLAIMSYDLDDKNRIQWNGKGQPRVKAVEQAKYRVEGAKLIFVSDMDRQSPFEKIKRALDGKDTQCFRLKAGETLSVHCPCNLPEDGK